MTVISAFFYLK